MSELAEKLFDSLRAMKEGIQAIAPGLEKAPAEIMAETARLGVQGSAELASALFGNSAFVPYGRGQNPPTVSFDHEPKRESQNEQELSRGGMER